MVKKYPWLTRYIGENSVKPIQVLPIVQVRGDQTVLLRIVWFHGCCSILWCERNIRGVKGGG
jgi:hypothetical protein